MFPNLYVHDPPHPSATQQSFAAHLGSGSNAVGGAVFEYVPPTTSRRASSTKSTSRRRSTRSSTDSSISTLKKARKFMGRLTAESRSSYSCDEVFDRSTLDGASVLSRDGNGSSIDTTLTDRESIHESKPSSDQTAAGAHQHCKSRGLGDPSEPTRQNFGSGIALSLQNKNVDKRAQHKVSKAAQLDCTFDYNRPSQQDGTEQRSQFSMAGSLDYSSGESQMYCGLVPFHASGSKGPTRSASNIPRDYLLHSRSTPSLQVNGCIPSSSSSSTTAAARMQSRPDVHVTSSNRRAVLLDCNWPPIVPIRLRSLPPSPQWEQHPRRCDGGLMKPLIGIKAQSTLMSTPTSLLNTPSTSTPQASNVQPLEQQDDKYELRLGSSFMRQEPPGQQHPYRYLRQPRSAPPAPLHPDSPTLPGLWGQASDDFVSSSCSENTASTSADDHAASRRPISSSTSDASLNNRYAWYLQDDELSVLTTIEVPPTKKRQVDVISSTNSSDSCGAEEKTPTLAAIRPTGNDEKQRRRRTDGDAWRRYQQKTMARDELHADNHHPDGEASTAAVSTALERLALSNRSRAQQDSTSTTTAPPSFAFSEPPTPASCFSPERMALRRLDDIELTDEDMSLLDVMCRETYLLSIKRQEDIRKRQELLSMKYEVPIPRLSSSAKRARVHEPVTTQAAVSPRRGSVSGATASPTLHRAPSKWRVRLSMGAKTPSTLDLNADSSSSVPSKSKSVDCARPPIKWMLPPSPWAPSFAAQSDVGSIERDLETRQSISERGVAPSTRSRSGSTSIRTSYSTPRSANLFPFVDPFGTQALTSKDSLSSLKSPTKQLQPRRDSSFGRPSVSSARERPSSASPVTPHKPSHLFPLPDPFGSHTVKPKRSTANMPSLKSDKSAQNYLDQGRRDSSTGKQQDDGYPASMVRLSQLLTPPDMLILPRHSFTASESASTSAPAKGGGREGSSSFFRRQPKTTRKRSCTVDGSSAPQQHERRI